MFMLRALNIGLSVADLDMLSIGMVVDMLIERANDECEYAYIATQEDIDRL